MSYFQGNFRSSPNHFRPRFQGNNGRGSPNHRGFPRHPFRPEFQQDQTRFINHGMPHEQHRGYGGPRPRYRGPSPGRVDGFPHHEQNWSAPPFVDQHHQPPRFMQSSSPQRFQGQNSNFQKNAGSNPKKDVGKGQKKKKGKEPKEINYTHYCDVCDRGFKTDEQLQTHISEHTQCKDNDCRFVAHPKVVKTHYKLQHGPDSKKIKWFDSPEEIEKWRNERKRNYPTATNIAKKKDIQELRQNQGNVLETKQFGKMKNFQRNQRGRGRGRGQHRGQERHDGKADQQVPVTSQSPDEAPAKKRKMEDSDQSAQPKPSPSPSQEVTAHIDEPMPPKPPSADCDPLSILALDNDDSGDDDATAHQTTPAIEVAPKGSFGALGSLAASYDSDSDESYSQNVPTSPEPKTTSLQNGKQEPPNETRPNILETRKSDAIQDDVTVFEEEGAIEEKEDAVKMTIAPNGAKSEPNGEQPAWEGSRKKRHPKTKNKANARRIADNGSQQKSTLLEMLLAPEIRRERNVILQCVRHIVKNNFFQDSGKVS